MHRQILISDLFRFILHLYHIVFSESSTRDAHGCCWSPSWYSSKLAHPSKPIKTHWILVRSWLSDCPWHGAFADWMGQNLCPHVLEWTSSYTIHVAIFCHFCIDSAIVLPAISIHKAGAVLADVVPSSLRCQRCQRHNCLVVWQCSWRK
jgi:hypothetical protein